MIIPRVNQVNKQNLVDLYSALKVAQHQLLILKIATGKVNDQPGDGQCNRRAVRLVYYSYGGNYFRKRND